MKKLIAVLVLVLALCACAPAVADMTLPSPEEYLGEAESFQYDEEDDETLFRYFYEDSMEADLEAYLSVLIDEYGLSFSKYEDEEGLYFISISDENPDAYVAVLLAHDSAGRLRMGFVFAHIAVGEAASGDEWAHIATKNGTVITVPSVFLGYDVMFRGTENFTHQNPPHTNYEFDAVPVEDLLRYAEEIDESPFFELVEVEETKYNTKYHYRYTGSDPSVTPSDRNLSLIINAPDREESSFYLFEYPGFSVDISGVFVAEGDDFWDPCWMCGGDGKCTSCGGRGYDSHYSPSLGWYEQDCTCSGGRCTACNGYGH